MAASTNITQRNIRGGDIDPVYIIGQGVDLAVVIEGIIQATITNIVQAQIVGNVTTVEWEFITLEDTDAGNDKTITVPTGYEYQVLSVYIKYTASGIVGDRQLEFTIRNSTNDPLHQVRPNITQAASEVCYYMIAPCLANLTDFYDDDFITTPLPPTLFLAGNYDFRIRDNNNVSNADVILTRIRLARKPV